MPDDTTRATAAGRGYRLPPPPSVGAGYVRRTGTTSPEMTEDFRVVCRHCKADLPALGDHTCPCLFSDEECPDHG